MHGFVYFNFVALLIVSQLSVGYKLDLGCSSLANQTQEKDS